MYIYIYIHMVVPGAQPIASHFSMQKASGKQRQVIRKSVDAEPNQVGSVGLGFGERQENH